jgi:hypothetical protein
MAGIEAIFEVGGKTKPPFRAIVLRYAQNVLAYLAQSVACNRLHNVIQRCAKWLLL